MEKEAVFKKLKEIIIDLFRPDGLDLLLTTGLSDIKNVDSLGRLTLFLETESTFNIHFSMQELMGIVTLNDIVELIVKNGRGYHSI